MESRPRRDADRGRRAFGAAGREGANLAMLDGSELGTAVAAHPDATETALAAYETAMFPRSESAAADAHQTLALCLDDGTPFRLIEFFTNALARDRDGAAQP